MIAFSVLDVVGYITAIIFLATLAYGIYAWLTGILPAVIRLGNGFAKRKIAIFATRANSDVLKNLLLDSKLFKEKNIVSISSASDFGRSEQTSLFLVFWDDWHDKIDEIFKYKKSGATLIVYAPSGSTSIPPDKYKDLNNRQNVIVTNLRGRLLNDIVVSMIATDYR